MKQHLHKKTLPLIAFLILSLLVNDRLLANINPPTPNCPIVTGRFQGLGDGATVDNSSTGWYLNASQVVSTAYFAVKSNRFHAQELGGEGIWYSKVFSVTGYSDFQVAVKVSSEGDMNSSEYVRIYYKINGGAETLLNSRTGNFGTLDFTSPVLTGNNVQLVVKLYNYNNGGSQTSKYYIEEYRVFKEHGPCNGGIPVTITTTNNGVLTCTNPSLTLTAGTTATGATTWSWSGPNGYTSTAQNPSVTVAGTYTATATNTAGSGSATMTVTENKTAPTVTATGAALACAGSVTISATSSVANSTFSWTGPGGFTSTQQNPSVSVAGTYTVTVTNPSNGCITSRTAVVTAGTFTTSTIWLQDFTRNNGTTSGNAPNAWTSSTPAGNFSVQNNVFYVNSIGTGSAEGVWTSEAFSISGKTNVSISVAVRSAATSGGALENNGSSLDYMRLYYKLNGGNEVLFTEYLGQINNNSATFSTASVGSLSGTTLQIIIRGRTTASDEHYYFDNVTVTGVTGGPVVTPSATGSITCTSSTAQLSATVSNGTASSYAWTGPNGFTSTIQNPVISVAGQYTVTATLSGGCTVSAPITITENKTPPANVNIASSTNSNEINCLVAGMILTASSSTPGTTYSWTIPSGAIITANATGAYAVGNYILTATNPATGCTTKDTFNVITNYAMASDGQITLSPAALTCSNSSVTLTGSNSLAGVTFTWATGTGTVLGTGPVLTVSEPGYYNLIMKHPVSGCNHTIGKQVSVVSDPPLNVTITTSSANTQINCTSGSVTLNGNSSTTGTTYAWTGPGGYAVSGSVAVVNTPGEYTLTATNPASNCTASVSTTIVSNTTQPVNVAATPSTNGGLLTCTFTSINLTGSSSTAGANYSWSGPSGFAASGTHAVAIVPGNYILTVTDPANGCSASSIASVTQNTTQPAGVSATHTDILTCLTTSTDLTGNSSTPGAIFLWTGPGGFSAITRNAIATEPGTYSFKVTNPVNGCSRTVSTIVAQDITPPGDVTASNNGPLTCAIGQVALTGSSSSMDVDYAWTGPDGEFISFAPVAVVSAAGIYTLTVTDLASNGCSASTTTTVLDACITDRGVNTGKKPAILNSEELPVKGFTHKVFPNPATNHAFIEFRAAGNDYVTVKLVNSNGSGEKMIFSSKVIAGHPYKLAWNAANLPAGIYYCIMTVNGKVYTDKLLLIK